MDALTIGADHWDNLVRVTDAHCLDAPQVPYSPCSEITSRPRHRSDAITLSWKGFAPRISLDITEAGRPSADDGRQ